MKKNIKLKKKIKRKKGKSKLYFTLDTQDAIVRYQKCEDGEERKNIYKNEISNAFNELVENLIFVYGFSALHETTDDLKKECVAFIYERIGKYNAEKGFKAFSYFSIVAKNFLIIKSKKRMASLTKNISLDDISSMTIDDVNEVEKKSVIINEGEEKFSYEEKITALESLLFEIKQKTQNKNEELCIDAIITIYENLNNIDFLNKRAVFTYIKDYSGLSGKQLTAAISSIRKYYREVCEKYNHYIYNENMFFNI